MKAFKATACIATLCIAGCGQSTPKNTIEGPFIRTGKAEANICSNYIIFSRCTLKSVMDSYPARFEQAFEFNNGKRCFFNTNGESVILSDGEEAIPQYVTFACRKAN